MARLPHGYTNRTERQGSLVVKTYDGPDRFGNADREIACLSALLHVLPVPTVVDADRSIPQITVGFLPGEHGQDLIEHGHAAEVLQLVGSALHRLQTLPDDAVPDLHGEGVVLVHGDFGPQNMLFDLGSQRITGIVDWESAHRGDPVEDLAWAEWLIRMHHPDSVAALDAMFIGAQQRPPWSTRHDAMLRHVRDLVAYCEAIGQASDWPRRLELTERWSE